LSILGIIPARFGATRLPGKPLINLNGKPMIQHVYEKCTQSIFLDDVIVATDCHHIFDVVKKFGGKVILTKMEHENGTNRCWEAYQKNGNTYDYIINIQGDEPYINPKQIDELCAALIQEELEIATLIKQEFDLEKMKLNNIVKATIDEHFYAINFTRNEIKIETNYFYKHIGLYAFKTEILEKIITLLPTENEQNERLEQLRWLDNGLKIKTQITQYESKSIDIFKDLISNNIF
jgi:3-deoxy-manno-octulosonate cytidylyltransferase (CMP-KDO synthetase)